MPSAIEAIFTANSGSYRAELNKIEADTLELVNQITKVPRALPFDGMASKVRAQVRSYKDMRKEIAEELGQGMLSAEDEAKRQERIRQADVEAASRRNRARALIREREERREEKREEERAKTRGQKIAEIRERMSSEVGTRERSKAEYDEIRIQRRLAREREKVQKEREASAAMYGPFITPEQRGQLELAHAMAQKEGKRIGGSFASGMRMAGPMFISALRDSIASAASGAPIAQIVAQQAPQVAQAFTMLGLRGAMMLKLGLAAAGGAAILGAIYSFLHITGARAGLFSGPEIADRSSLPFAKSKHAEEAIHDLATALKDAQKEFYGAAGAAQRYAESVAYAAQHSRALLDLAKQQALMTARTPAQKLLVEQQFGAASLQMSKMEREAEIEGKRKKAKQLRKEADDAEKKSISLKTGTPEVDAEVLKQKAADAENARKMRKEWFDRDRDKYEGETGLISDFKYFFSDTFGQFGEWWRGEIGGEAKDRVLGKQMEYRQQIIDYNEMLKRSEANKAATKEQDRLNKENQSKSKEAELLEAEYKNLEEENQRKTKAEAEVERSRMLGLRMQEALSLGARPDLTQNQKIGAYSAPAAQYQIQTNQLNTQQNILAILKGWDAARKTASNSMNTSAEAYP